MQPKLLIAVAAIAVASLAGNTAMATRDNLYQGKDVTWWAKHTVQARKDANARAFTIKRLRRTLNHSPTIQESVKLAVLVFPEFSENCAWRIIRHESWDGTEASLVDGKPARARNRHPWGAYSEHATGLYQFLPSTFRSTPFGHMSIYSPYAQSLAAGWMHKVGRGGEWAPTVC